jgi:hypothetical protein
VTTIAELQQYAGQALADVFLCANTERRANAIARLLSVAQQLINAGEIESRLTALERQIAGII